MALLATMLVTLAVAGPASAADSLTVQSRILPDSIHLYGSYHVQPPPGCPALLHTASLAGVTAYYSAGCRRYVSQTADLALRLFHNGRLIYHETLVGIPGLAPQQGAAFDADLYRFELGNQCGSFTWTVTLYDPFFRSAFTASRRGSFTAPCS